MRLAAQKNTSCPICRLKGFASSGRHVSISPLAAASFHRSEPGVVYAGVDPAGVYFGTSTGQVFYSRNEDRKWELLADYLPPV